MPPVKLSDEVYSRLKALSKRFDTPMAHLVANWIEKNESHKVVRKMSVEEIKAGVEMLKKKLDVKEEEETMCDECEEVIPADSSFCPYCGVEFEEDEDEEEEE